MAVTTSPSGVGTAFQYSTQVGGSAGYSSIISAAPGFVNPPVIFEPMPSLSGGALSVWIVVTGPPPDWGGCQIWASVDGGTSYGQLGVMMVGGVQGLLTAIFPPGSDPDTVNVLSVDVSMCGQQINSASHGDADLGISLAYVDHELVGYSNAVLTSTDRYNLDTYIRRGMFDSVVGSHAIGTQFALLGGHVFSQTYPSIMIGTTINFKFPSFNQVGGQIQDISTVVAYPFTITGVGALLNSWFQSFSVGGKFTDLVLDEWDGNYEIFDVQAPVALTFPNNFSSSPVPGCEVAPLTAVTLNFQVMHAGGTTTALGTLTFAAGSTTGVYNVPGGYVLAAGDRLRLYAPSSVDTTITGLYGTIAGTR